MQERLNMPGQLTGKRALVIGAAGAVGSAIAVALADAGADVAVASASLDGMEVMAVRKVKRRIEELGRRSFDSAFDVTLGQNVQVSTRQVAKELGGLDSMVYAVDLPFAKPITQTTDAEWQRVINHNLSGAFFACRAAVREMQQTGGGCILLVGGTVADPGAVSYLAARFGLAGMVQALSAEVRVHGIRVNGIVPFWPGPGTDPGDLPADILHDPANLAVYLASEDGVPITGCIFTMDRLPQTR
jgi:NAD(P)-dependent dehydrogenase (short-subunit alcohol dehydrogenase family)